MSDQPDSNEPIIGNTVQVAIITDDLYRGLDQLVALGIGPFSIFKVTPDNCTEMRYKGEPAEFSMSVAFTTAHNMMWEVIQPHSGRTIYQDFLDEGHIGLHHVAVDMSNLPFEERTKRLTEQGYTELQGGIGFNGQAPFGYFHNGAPDAPIVEIFQFPEGFDPEPDEIYPG
jgi:hypothetical protein